MPHRHTARGLALIFSLILVFITLRFGWLRNWFPGIPGILVTGINPATLSAVLYIAWAGWIRRRTGSSRMSAISMFTCILTGILVFTAIGIWFRGPNWEFYWSPSQWPVL